MDPATLLTTVKDIMVAIAAITTTGVAVIGLEKWRHEIRGKSDFEAARELAVATYKLRSAVDKARHPLIAIAEYPPHFNVLRDTNPHERGQAFHYILEARWKPVADSLGYFEAAALQAEALHGPAIHENCQRLISEIERVKATAGLFIGMMTLGQEDKGVYRILFSPESLDEEDEIKNKLREIVKEIVGKLQPHLARAT